MNIEGYVYAIAPRLENEDAWMPAHSLCDYSGVHCIKMDKFSVIETLNNLADYLRTHKHVKVESTIVRGTFGLCVRPDIGFQEEYFKADFNELKFLVDSMTLHDYSYESDRLKEIRNNVFPKCLNYAAIIGYRTVPFDTCIRWMQSGEMYYIYDVCGYGVL